MLNLDLFIYSLTGSGKHKADIVFPDDPRATTINKIMLDHDLEQHRQNRYGFDMILAKEVENAI